MQSATATTMTSALLLVLLVSSAAALQCYQCASCGSSIGTKTTCGAPNDSCMVSGIVGMVGCWVVVSGMCTVCVVVVVVTIIRRKNKNFIDNE